MPPVAGATGGVLIDLAGGDITRWHEPTISLLAPFVNCPYQQGSRTCFIEVPNQWDIVWDEFEEPSGRIDDVHNTKEYRENE